MPRSPITWFVCLTLALAPAGAVRGDLPRAPIEDEERTEVLVLGTEHLSALGDSFNEALLDGVLSALERYRPDAVAVEQLPPSEIAALALQADAWPGGASAQLVEAFCADAVALGADAQSILGLTWADARARADSLLESPGGASPSGDAAGPGSSPSLVSHLLAAYDVPSALLHLSGVPDGPDSPDLGLSDESRSIIRALERSPNEFVSIGVTLAERLGHRRVYSIDDHVDDLLGMEWGTWDVLGEELPASPEYAEFAASPYMEDAQSRLQSAAESGDLLELTRRLSSPEHGRWDIESQWHLFYRMRLPSGTDRARVSLWEARNFNIAARIMEVCAAHPGGRVLVVIGAAHKPFLDEYLGDSMDVRLVSFEDVVSGGAAEGR